MFRGDMAHYFSISLFATLMIIAGIGDALSLRIPNLLNQIIFISFFPLAWAAGMPLELLGLHFLTCIVLLVVGFLFFTANVIGGGDAKLLATSGLWIGPMQAAPFLIQTVVAGGVLAAIVLIGTRISSSWQNYNGPFSSKIAGLHPQIPYGYAFAIGAILVFPKTWWMVSFG
jgi:prepilin peptidase CpaA